MLAFESFLQAIDQAFAKTTLTTAGLLRRNRLIRQAASEAYDALPFVVRTGIRYSIGKDGFARFVLHLRDVQHREGVACFTSLNRETIRELYNTAPEFVRELMSPPSGTDEPISSATEMAPPATGEAPRNDSARWHVLRGDAPSGPFIDTEFLQLAEAGQLLPTDMVWRAGLDTWVALADLPAFVSSGPRPPSGSYLAA